MPKPKAYDGKSGWQHAAEAVEALGGSASLAEVTKLLRSKYPGYQDDISANLNKCSVNSNSRTSYGDNNPRRTDGNQRRDWDLLFKRGFRKDVTYELYNPNRHGVWERKEAGGKWEKVDDAVKPDESAQLPFRHVADAEEHAEVGATPPQDEPDIVPLLPEEVFGASEFVEGATTAVIINAYERNPRARRACLEHYGLSCVICSFNFMERYGENARNIIHVHHVVPLRTIGKQYIVDPIVDLRPVCPNCHAVIHSRREAFSIEEVEAMHESAALH